MVNLQESSSSTGKITTHQTLKWHKSLQVKPHHTAAQLANQEISINTWTSILRLKPCKQKVLSNQKKGHLGFGYTLHVAKPLGVLIYLETCTNAGHSCIQTFTCSSQKLTIIISWSAGECGQNQHNSTTYFEVDFREIARKIVNRIWTMTTPFMLQPHPAVPSDASFPSKPPRWLWASESAKAAAEVSTNTLGMPKPSWWWCSILGGPHIPTNNMEQLSLVKKGTCWKKVNGQYMSILHPLRVYNWYSQIWSYDLQCVLSFLLQDFFHHLMQKHIKTHRSAASLCNTWPMRTNKNFVGTIRSRKTMLSS